ncbi:MAG TPA: ATP-dependent DNA ligase [Mycobacteriales bacterium]|nr:ATP-dependent DNA ligase [Mycobacteriales bacterium]
MLLAEVAATSAAVAATSSRTRKVELLSSCLARAAPDDVPVVVAYLSGDLPQRRTGVGHRSLADLPPPAPEPALTPLDVDLTFSRIAACSGSGSTGERRRLLAELFARATEPEQRLLRGLVSGELRQGALESLVTDAVARAAGLPLADVRRAVMLRGALAPVADAALRHGAPALAGFRLEVGRPVQPMLASPATDVADAVARLGTAAFEWKLDGVRVQVHRSGTDVGVFTRTLDDVTARVPELVEVALALPVENAVLDGEAIALAPDGRPRPFQVTGARVATRGARGDVPLTPFFFDALHVDGADLLGAPGTERWAALAAAVPAGLLVPRTVTGDEEAARAFFDDAVGRGHEGVVAKGLDLPYEAGRRGAGWLKVKPRHTLDLVVLAAEWGHGRRRGWLSNLHLGARDPDAGGWVMLGKTFKGLTDELLAWQTGRLLELETSRNARQVFVRPELVVEIAFDGVQTSPRYPGGVALRFARVLRYRDDKPAGEADTIHSVRALHTT